MLFNVARLRWRLLVRDRRGWGALAAGLACVPLSLTFAQVSFLDSVRIYWDFVLASSFIVQVLMAAYVSTSLFDEERRRRTLSLVLASGVSRSAWLVGNGLGLWAVFSTYAFAWWLAGVACSALAFGSGAWLLGFQAQLVLCFETLILISVGLALSLWVRPFLAFLGVLVLTFFLHSVSSLERIFVDPQTGRFVQADGARLVLKAAHFLPPLESFDLRVLVGYETSAGWGLVATLVALGVAWSALLLFGAAAKLERTDV